MTRSIYDPWFKLGMDSWLLGYEAATVIGLRTLKMAAGGAAATAEAELMVREKIDAAVALQGRAVSGGLGADLPGAMTATVAHYRRHVRANRKRLTRS